ncbi:hypothetical protein Cob_v012371 [Colletotrichum orbiculare MAFF 240422]|uniref:Uncharacterized protein n=1 Tax=Colletotrichum orbiculare (strain 104-T / ATCC 96160 / CBS 514.97 / LARS 414 / MAFF 240422) TaxID=1213857 RepID=A0A484F9W4_COLOR|nr:hypothetical protein Cob_v012371 [Colletotrichum orbiculare MAFF 240422]
MVGFILGPSSSVDPAASSKLTTVQEDAIKSTLCHTSSPAQCRLISTRSNYHRHWKNNQKPPLATKDRQ